MSSTNTVTSYVPTSTVTTTSTTTNNTGAYITICLVIVFLLILSSIAWSLYASLTVPVDDPATSAANALNSTLDSTPITGSGTGAASTTANNITIGSTISLQGQATRWPGYNGFLVPCGTTTQGCGTNVTVRPEASFSTNAILKNWNVLGAPTGYAIKYGDVIELKAQNGTYLSPCGTTPDGCGINVALRPDASFNAYEPNSLLRKWQVLGGTLGNQVNSGDIIELKAQASRFPGHDGYLAPCGTSTSDCGVNVTLRPDNQFTQFEPNSMLRKWKVTII